MSTDFAKHHARVESECVRLREENRALLVQCRRKSIVLQELIDFHKEYDRNTHGCGMPGNALYSGMLMQIVGNAIEAVQENKR